MLASSRRRQGRAGFKDGFQVTRPCTVGMPRSDLPLAAGLGLPWVPGVRHPYTPPRAPGRTFRGSGPRVRSNLKRGFWRLRRHQPEGGELESGLGRRMLMGALRLDREARCIAAAHPAPGMRERAQPHSTRVVRVRARHGVSVRANATGPVALAVAVIGLGRCLAASGRVWPGIGSIGGSLR